MQHYLAKNGFQKKRMNEKRFFCSTVQESQLYFLYYFSYNFWFDADLPGRGSFRHRENRGFWLPWWMVEEPIGYWWLSKKKNQVTISEIVHWELIFLKTSEKNHREQTPVSILNSWECLFPLKFLRILYKNFDLNIFLIFWAILM